MIAPILFALVASSLVEKHAYSYDAIFLEGCSCKDVCVTEITGSDAGCHGLAAMEFRRATYNGKDFSGTRAAWAWGPGWVHMYLDAKGKSLGPLAAFLRAALADWGTMETATVAKVTLGKSGRNFTATVADGRTASITVVPVMGGDGKTAVEHTNLASVFHDRLNQGKIKSASYREPGHEADWNGTNAFFNAKCTMKGKV